ncbi:mCG147884 [Mus musculus]|nr:mCG147884 [Mus musculus]
MAQDYGKALMSRNKAVGPCAVLPPTLQTPSHSLDGKQGSYSSMNHAHLECGGLIKIL